MVNGKGNSNLIILFIRLKQARGPKEVAETRPFDLF